MPRTAAAKQDTNTPIDADNDNEKRKKNRPRLTPELIHEPHLIEVDGQTIDSRDYACARAIEMVYEPLGFNGNGEEWDNFTKRIQRQIETLLNKEKLTRAREIADLLEKDPQLAQMIDNELQRDVEKRSLAVKIAA